MGDTPNGLTLEKLKINERLTRIEATSDERLKFQKEQWRNHDQHSKERSDLIKESFKEVNCKLDKLPCSAQVEKVKGIDVAMGRMWKLIAGIAMLIIGLGIRGVWFK